MNSGNLPSRSRSAFGLSTALLVVGTLSAQAVILYETGAINANTTAPTGDLAGSGWQYLGQIGGFVGTTIAPNFFLTAAHIGGASLVGSSFLYHDTSYTITAAFTQANSDLCIFRVDGTFDSYAPLYTNAGGEVGKDLVVFGRGTQRGTPLLLPNGTRGGWNWGDADTTLRWGENTVSQIVTDPHLGSLLYATFDAGAGPNEAHLSSGDSGGAVFIRDTDDIWKLAGVNYGVDGYFYRSSSGADPFIAALYDTTDLYAYNGSGYESISGPSGFYSTEVASELDFIYSVVPEPSSGLLPVLGASLLTAARRYRKLAPSR